MAENLYRKLRPGTWDEVLGNEANIKQLKKFVKSADRPHTFLFTGGSGCGKTTLARIFAKEMGADDLTVKEINMADNRGIDTMREIIEKMRYVSPGGNPVVYILDEFHRATADAQSAMLKPFEDTPDHIYFIICTTDPQKVLTTIKTRCTHIQVDAVDNRSLFHYLSGINTDQKFNLSKDVLMAIVSNSGGSVRKALVLLEQASGIEEEEQQLQVISQPSAETAQTIDLCRALLKRNWKATTEVLKILKEEKTGFRGRPICSAWIHEQRGAVFREFSGRIGAGVLF